MSLRFVTIAKIVEVNRGAFESVVTVRDMHGNEFKFTTDDEHVPPVDRRFEVRITECGDFYGTG